MPTLLVAKFSGDEEPTVSVEVGGTTHDLTRERARELRDALDDALTARREFLHTEGYHREDGAYVVERRGADSAGHRKVFPTPAALHRLYERLPDTFTAEDLTRTGVTDARRHLVLWHLVEHPDFDCELDARQPLRATKGGAGPDMV